jgi:hypothetical protein
MGPKPPETALDPDNVETMPAIAPVAEPAPPVSDGWDSEAPTAVHAIRPLFARPPRLPRT